MRLIRQITIVTLCPVFAPKLHHRSQRELMIDQWLFWTIFSIEDVRWIETSLVVHMPVYQCRQQLVLLMSEFKISENKTGTLFYTRIGEGSNKPYRVRFKSFQLGLFQNRNLVEGLEHMQHNYQVFKQKKAVSRRDSRPLSTADRVPRLFKNLKERSKEGEDLKSRLKSMRDTRKSIFQKIKSLND